MCRKCQAAESVGSQHHIRPQLSLALHLSPYFSNVQQIGSLNPDLRVHPLTLKELLIFTGVNGAHLLHTIYSTNCEANQYMMETASGKWRNLNVPIKKKNFILSVLSPCWWLEVFSHYRYTTGKLDVENR